MDSQIALGKEGKLQFQIMDGEVKVSIGFDGADVSAGAFVMASPDQIIKALGDIIPGDSAIEKTVLGGLKVAFDAAMTQSATAPAQAQTLAAGSVSIK